LVDDEQNLLDGLTRQLRHNFDVCTASSGRTGLDMIRSEPAFDVIVSDMRMPEMNGIEFLLKAQELCPNTVRMMLTGNSDQKTAIDAINQGAIFRFLTKPTASEDLISAIDACGKQHDLIVAEKELLESTLSGCVRVLMDILSIAHPESFGRSQTLKSRASLVAKYFNVKDLWQIELAALLSTIGAIVIPPTILVKSRTGQPLNDYETKLISRIPTLGATLLAQIPRLDIIANILRQQETPFTSISSAQPVKSQVEIPIESRILKVLTDLMSLEDHGHTLSRAFFVLRSSKTTYDPEVLSVTEKVLLTLNQNHEPLEVSIDELATGMKVAANIVTREGVVLVAKGTPVSAALLERIKSSAPYYKIIEPILVERQD
jgi:response regulator RpfG family c-di-GMP phosphodiesterase